MSLLKRLEGQNNQGDIPSINPIPKRKFSHHNLQGIKKRVHKILLDEWDSMSLTRVNSSVFQEELRLELEKAINRVLDEEGQVLPRVEVGYLMEELVDEIAGFGPISNLLEDPGITEIMVNGYSKVYVERRVIIEETDVTFTNDAHVMHVIEKIIAPIGRHVDESSPMVDARLPDGSRVNVIIPPLSLVGPVITIRKFSRDTLTMEDLIGYGTLMPKMASFLQACVEARLNIVISGGTSSGKTTTLNIMSSFIPASERIVTIEDAAELQLKQEHVITLEIRPPNIEGRGAVTTWDLVRNSLRMRPDRIVVGEVRGGEALDMLQAMNTGHDGSLTTGHSNSPRDMLSRIETMVLMSGVNLPDRAIKEQIASAIDLIVHQERLKDGNRKITRITEVAGMEGETITLQDLFVYEVKNREHGRMAGEFRSTGIRPGFLDKFYQRGVSIVPDWFE